MRVLVIPVKEDEKDKPVAIVEPTGPSLPPSSGKINQKKGSKSKRARLDSVLNGLYAKKGVKNSENNESNPESPTGSDGSGDRTSSTNGTSPPQLNLELNSSADLQLKTKDGQAKIKILQRINDTDDVLNETFNQKSSSVSISIKLQKPKLFPSSSVPSNGSTSDGENRKLSADSSKSELENDLSPPPLEEIDHAPSPTASSCSDYEQLSPRILQPTQNNTSDQSTDQKAQSSQCTTPKPVLSSQIRNAQSAPKYEPPKNGPRIDQEQKVQMERPMNSNPKPKPTPTPTSNMVSNRQHQSDLPHKPRSKAPNSGQKGPSPKSQKAQRSIPIPVSQPYVYQAPSAAPRQAPPTPLIPSPVMKTAIPKPRSKPMPTPPPQPPPQHMPADNEDDDAPLDLVMYDKKKPKPNPPKESKPPTPKPPTPTKEQNKPLNLKRISGGAVFATVNLKGPKKAPIRTNNEPRGQMQVRSPTKSPIKSNQPGFPVHRNTSNSVMTGRDGGQYQPRPRLQNGPGPSGQGKVNAQVMRNPQNPPPIPPRKPNSRPKPRVSQSEEVFKNYPQQTPPQQSSNVVLKQSNSPIEQSSHGHHERPGPSNHDRPQTSHGGHSHPGSSHSGPPKAEVKMSKSPQKRQDGKVNTPLKPLQMEGRKIFTSCTIKTPGSRKPNPKTPPVQRHNGQPNPNQGFRQSSPPEYKPEESELNGPMGQQSLESRLNKEYGSSRKRSSPSGQPGPRPALGPSSSPRSPVKNCPPKYEPNDEQDLSPTTPNYAPRTKYPPPTPVENCKWPAIKTIKMANGETCGIKVQTPVNKANITNSMLRGVKQQIIKECDLQSAVRSAVCDFKSHVKEAQRKHSGPDGAKFSPIVKPGPRPRTPKASDGSNKPGSAGPKKTNLLNKLSGHQVISSVKVKTPSQSSKSQKPKSNQSEGPAAKKMKNSDSEKAKDITITADAKQADDGSTENVPLVLSPENQGKSDFALAPVEPGAQINPAFPLVKVAKKDFQLIPVQKPPTDTPTAPTPPTQVSTGTTPTQPVVASDKLSKAKQNKQLATLMPKPEDELTGSNLSQPDVPAKSMWRTNTVEEEPTVIHQVDQPTDAEPKKISLRTLSASSSANTSPTKPLTGEQAAMQQQQLHQQLQQPLQHLSNQQNVNQQMPSNDCNKNDAALNIQPKVASQTVNMGGPLAIPPGSIANQMMNRKARQPPAKKKERPMKIKKIASVGNKKLVPLLPQGGPDFTLDPEFHQDADADDYEDQYEGDDQDDIPIPTALAQHEMLKNGSANDITGSEIDQTETTGSTRDQVEYEPVPNPFTPSFVSPTVDTAPPPPDFIDTSIPMPHPDLEKPTYQTIDQWKKEIAAERSSSATPPPLIPADANKQKTEGMNFIYFA